MNFIISAYKPGRPQVPMPPKEMFSLLQEEGIRQLVSDHYNLLRESSIAHLFPKNPVAFEKAKEHSADFFIQICGGPMYFNKNRGKPQLFKRHLPHKINPAARVVWLDCYKQVLEKLELPDNVKQTFWDYLDIFSIWMVNTELS